MPTPPGLDHKSPAAPSVTLTPASPLERPLPRTFYFLAVLGFAGVLAALISYTLACIRFAALGADQSWLLFAASRVLAGFPLDGTRVVESNPPLIVWFSLLPDLLSRWLHASPLLILKIIVIAVALGSSAWCTRVLHAARLTPTPLFRWLAFFAIAAVGVSRDLVTYGQFGEREQLVFLLTLPYLLYSACVDTLEFTTAHRVTLGIAAAIGFCFKPQQILVLVAFELFLLLWTRNPWRLLRPELLSVALSVCVYILVVFFATPYFQAIVPLLADTYWAFADSTKLTLAREAFLNPKFFFALIFAVGVRRYLRYQAAPLAFLAASFGAGLAYVQQGMAWNYHLFPATALLLCAFGWIGFDLLSAHFAPPLAPRSIIVVATLTLALIAISLPRFFAREQRQADLTEKFRSDLYTFVRRYPPHTPFYVFSTCNGEFFLDVVQSQLDWTSRYNHLWMLPAIVENERAFAGGPAARKSISPGRVAELASMLRSDTTEDLRMGKPSFVVVEHCNPVTPCQGLHAMNFSMLQWFLKSPAFAAEWSNYRLESTEKYFDVFTRQTSTPN